MKKNLFLVILILLILIANFSLFVVDETKQAIILQFGKPIKAIQEAGLYIKIPLFMMHSQLRLLLEIRRP